MTLGRVVYLVLVCGVLAGYAVDGDAEGCGVVPEGGGGLDAGCAGGGGDAVFVEDGDGGAGRDADAGGADAEDLAEQGPGHAEPDAAGRGGGDRGGGGRAGGAAGLGGGGGAGGGEA